MSPLNPNSFKLNPGSIVLGSSKAYAISRKREFISATILDFIVRSKQGINNSTSISIALAVLMHIYLNLIFTRFHKFNSSRPLNPPAIFFVDGSRFTKISPLKFVSNFLNKLFSNLRHAYFSIISTASKLNPFLMCMLSLS